MKFLKSGLYYLAIILLIIAVLSPEVEGRRKILRGRKTITRTYYRSAAIPAWAIIVIVGLGMLLVGGAVYGVLYKIVIKNNSQGGYAPPADNMATMTP